MAKPKPQFMPENCKQCRYFYQAEPRNEAGYCRRNPPVFAGVDEDPETGEESAMFCFPMVAVDEWCGAFLPVSQ